jgi:prepilin-type N-terminal cleavage/methylation domain-containing protein
MFRQKTNNPVGFTLIEILMVAAIIGVMLAVIIPRAFRAQVDTKYSIVRQTAAEMGQWGMTWAQRNLEAQAETDTCRLNNYVADLVRYTGEQTATNNYWAIKNAGVGNQGPTLVCRGGAAAPMSVEAIMPEDKKPKNPFNGVSYFMVPNDGSANNAGVLCLVVVEYPLASGMMNYYFVYLGTDSTGVAAPFNDWTAGMGSGFSPTIDQARNGVFMARLAQ